MSILNKLKSAGFSATPVQTTTTELRPASPAQQQWYLTLCEQKDEKPMVGWETLDARSISNEIERLKKIPNFVLASQRQIDFLNEMCEDLGIDKPNCSNLSVTKASEMIETLRKIHTKVMAEKPSKKQLELLTQMLYCPDVDESELTGIPQSLIDDYIHSKDELAALYAMEEVKIQKALKEKTPKHEFDKMKSEIKAAIESETAKQLKLREAIEEYENNFSLDSLKKTAVSEFIAKYNAPYREWLKTRASEGQRKLINDLLIRNGQEPLEYSALIQFNREQASKTIEQLQTGKIVNLYEERQHEFKRGAKSAKEAFDLYNEQYEAIIHKLCAMANMGPDDAKLILIQTEEEQESSLSEIALIASFMNSEDSVEAVLEEIFDEQAIATILMK